MLIAAGFLTSMATKPAETDFFYTLHFDGNGNSSGTVPADKQLTMTEEYVIPESALSRDEAQFLGWATNAVSEACYQPGDVVKGLTSESGATVTLYAVWEVIVDPDEPVTPDEPDTPEEPDTPDEPVTPDEPDTPEEPDTPDEPEEVSEPRWAFEALDENQAKLTGITLIGPTDLVLPSTISGLTVTAFVSVGEGLVNDPASVTSVDIPGTVKVVVDGAFMNCSNLTNVVFHTGTEQIGRQAFSRTHPTASLDIPASVTSISADAFDDASDGLPYDADGYKFIDTAKTCLLRVRNDVDRAPEGVCVLMSKAFLGTTCEKISIPASVTTYGSELFCESVALREVVFNSSALLHYRDMFRQTETVTNITLFGGTQEVGSFASSPSPIATVRFLTTPPNWNVSDKFPQATTLVYDSGYAEDWAAYRTSYPAYEYVRLGGSAFLETRVGHYLEPLDLASDLGIAIDADYAAGDKVTVKIEGLAKGLKLATTQYKATTGKKAVTNVIYTIGGVPTETIDAEKNPMYARVTVTRGKSKSETLTALPLSILPATVVEFPETFVGSNYAASVTSLWPEADVGWTFKGWPAGLKYVAAEGGVSGKPTKAGVFTVTASHKEKLADGKTTVTETETATLTVWGNDGLAEFRYVDQAYVPIESRMLANAKGAAGLPKGIKFANGVLSGTPTASGVFAVTLTMSDKTAPKETFLWKVTDGANDGILSKIGWAASESTVTAMQGAIRAWNVDMPDGAKVTVTGLPAGLKLAQDKQTKRWSIAGTPTKEGASVVSFKTVLNGKTIIERISLVVEPNEWTGNWYAVQRDAYTASSLHATVAVAANGTVKLTLVEGSAATSVKTSLTAKNIDEDGCSATLGQRVTVDFAEGVFSLDGSVVADLCETMAVTVENKSVQTYVLEEVIGEETNDFAYVTATYDEKKNAFALAGKLWDGSAVKGTAYPLDWPMADGGIRLSSVLVTDKEKNAVSLELSSGSLFARVIENGEKRAIGPDGTTAWSALLSATELKNKTFGDFVAADRLTVLAPVEAASSPYRQEIDLPLSDKDRKAKLAANGLVKFTLADASGWKWVCELLPVGTDGEIRFRGIATGSKKGEALDAICESGP